MTKIEEIAKFYGFDSQSHMLIEEMAELTQAINKLYRTNHLHGYPTNLTKSRALDNIYEEIADVSICLDEVIHLMHCDDKVNEWRKLKIDRQFGRMEKEIKWSRV